MRVEDVYHEDEPDEKKLTIQIVKGVMLISVAHASTNTQNVRLGFLAQAMGRVSSFHSYYDDL